MFTIEVDEETYQLVGPGGEESGVTDYGQEAEVEVDGKTYVTMVESKDEAIADPPDIYLCLEESPAVEEVEFELEDETDEEEDEGEGEPDAA